MSRHHPTVDILEGGSALVAWQRGKRESAVAVQAYDAQWHPRSDEQVVSEGQRNATHPQVFVDGDAHAMLWTDDATGKLWMTKLGPTGAPLDEPVGLLPDVMERPGLYGDAAFDDDGQIAALWFTGNEPSPQWQVTTLNRSMRPTSFQDIEPQAGAQRGGPPTVRVAPDGTPWLAWTEQNLTPPSRVSRVLIAPLRPGEPIQPRALASGPYRWERPALAFRGDGSFVLGWTGYPFGSGTWSAWAMRGSIHDTEAQEPFRLDTRQGRMVDVDASGDLAVIAWEEPHQGRRRIFVRPTRVSGATSCETVLAHPGSSFELARANVKLHETPDGTVEGVLVWHASTSTPRHQSVWGRRFQLVSAYPVAPTR